MSKEQDNLEGVDPAELKFRSRPLTTGGGIENGIRFYTTAMNALDRIEGLLGEIERTRTLVHQMIGEFSLTGCGLRAPRLTPEGRHTSRIPKKLLPEKKEVKERDYSTPR